MTKTIINIVCLGHSGSTLLGNILGGHSSIFHIGELVAPMQKGKKIICMDCQDEPCPVWGKTITQKDLLREHRRFEFWKKSRIKFRLNDLMELRYKSIYERLFNSMEEVSFIVDSSKNIDWYKFQRKNNSFNVRYVFLKREPKAVISSLMRVHNNDLKNVVDIVKQSIANLNYFFHQLQSDQVIVMSYEKLATDFQTQIKFMAVSLGIKVEKGMYEFNQYRHHLIGGNQAVIIQKIFKKASKLSSIHGYNEGLNDYSFYKDLSGISLDERWKTKLSQKQMDYIDQELGSSCFAY